MTSAVAFPLIARPPGAALFRATGRAITAAAFAAAARHLAATLPDATHVLNLCRSRERFALGIAAALLRGQVSLLVGDRTPEGLRKIADAYPGLYAMADDAEAVGPFPHVVLPEIGDAGAPAGDMPWIAADRLAAIVFTSGSTGEPVGHRKSWGQLVTRSEDAGRRFGLRRAAPGSIVGMVPPHHMYGFETTVLLPLHAPACVWAGDSFYPADVQAALDAMPAPSTLVTTPLQMRALLDAGLDGTRLGRVISATAPLYPEPAARAEAAWGVPVEEIFGATEVGSIASRRTVEGETWRMYPRVRLLGAVQDDPESEALVTGPFAAPFPLSDHVERQEGARFRLIGRRTDVVKLGGRRTTLAGLNRALCALEGVRDGVFVAPDDLEHRPNARLAAFAVAPDRPAAALLEDLRERIDPVFMPRPLVTVPSLPRNSMGKLTAEAARALYARLLEPQ